MSHKGLDVYVLEGGIPNASSEAAAEENSSEPVADIEPAKPDTSEDEMASGIYVAEDQDLESLRADNEKLLAEIKEKQSIEARLKDQIEQLRGELGESNDKLSELYAQTKEDAELLKQLRGELCETGEKLYSTYAQMKSDAEEKQLLQDQYAALQQQHADTVSAHKLELEQLEEQLHQSRSLL